MVRYAKDYADFTPTLSQTKEELVDLVYKPVRTFLDNCDYTTAIDIADNALIEGLLLDDLVGVLYHAILDDSLAGPVNAVAPEPVNVTVSPAATGNSVVLKPASNTPLSALFIARLAAEAGGAKAFNVFLGLGIGALLLNVAALRVVRRYREQYE